MGLSAVLAGGTSQQKFLELTRANELILHSDFYRLEDRLRSYEIVAAGLLKPTTQQK